MPIYEYECSACSHQFETMRKVSDEPLTKCPVCGKDGLQKLISKVAFRLKGTGWYETDFKGKPAAAKTDTAAKATTDAKPTDTHKDASTSDAKPAASSKTESAKPAAKTED